MTTRDSLDKKPIKSSGKVLVRCNEGCGRLRWQAPYPHSCELPKLTTRPVIIRGGDADCDHDWDVRYQQTCFTAYQCGKCGAHGETDSSG